MSECSNKHTVPQVPDEHWKCPKCKVTAVERIAGSFVIDESPEGAEDCPLVHDEDTLHCYNCGYTTTGKKYAKRYATTMNLVPCAACMGKGVIAKELQIAENRIGKSVLLWMDHLKMTPRTFDSRELYNIFGGIVKGLGPGGVPV